MALGGIQERSGLFGAVLMADTMDAALAALNAASGLYPEIGPEAQKEWAVFLWRIDELRGHGRQILRFLSPTARAGQLSLGVADGLLRAYCDQNSIDVPQLATPTE